MHTITLSGFRRPQLFKQTLAALAANDLRGWRISIRIEPSPLAQTFAPIAASELRGHDFSVVVNQTRLGVDQNPFRMIDAVFSGGSTLNLCLEEDSLVSPDATALASWYERNHRPNWLCLCLMAGACGTTGMLSDRRHPDAVFAAKLFTSHGFAVRADEWRRHVRAAWMRDQVEIGVPDDVKPPRGWDWSIYALVASHPDLVTVQPVLARVTHTGREGGEYCAPEFHDAAFGNLPIAAVVPVAYHLVDVETLPHEVRSHVHVLDELRVARLALAQRGGSSHRRNWLRRMLGRR